MGHVARKHGSVEEYLLRHEYGGIRPKCKCGCGQETQFTRSWGMCFKDYIHGHHAVGHVVTKEMRKKIGAKNSVNVTNKYLSGGFQWSRGHYRSIKTGKDCYYRSSWELRHMQNLDQDETVAWWDYEPRSFEYQWNGGTHRYIPDFIVRYKNGSRELQEIGVKKMKESIERNIAKREAAMKWCSNNNVCYRIISFEGENNGSR